MARELRLSRALAEKRIYPAVDLDASSTRREELLLDAGERQLAWQLRRTLGGLDRQPAIGLLLDKLRETPSNAAFLGQISGQLRRGGLSLAVLVVALVLGLVRYRR